ncbi:ABC transporter permease, partial [Candidatus Nomurabacteria bacterium]|nr:ABC transporter permease [Candidatus Nomurabacteria bacterium]
MAIYILWLRQIKKYWRSKPRIIGSLGQPLLFLLAFGYGFGPIFSRAGDGNYLQFLAPGIVGMSIIFTAMFAGIEVIWDRQFGFLKETLVAPVSRVSIALGRTLGGATIATIQGIIVLGISMLIGFRPVSYINLFAVLVVMFFAALLFTAIGTAIATRMRDMQAFPLIMNFIMMPLFFLSGSLFPIDGLPKTLAIIIKINPLTYSMDAIRGLLTGVYHFNLG